jgi:hypothetical protein
MDFFGSIYDAPLIDQNNSDFLNIYSLTDDIDKRITLRTKVYTEVLRKAHFKIKQASVNMKHFCIFTIPEYLVGMPLYNFNHCKMFLMNRLLQERFDLKFFIPNILFVSWKKILHPTPGPIGNTGGKKHNNVEVCSRIQQYPMFPLEQRSRSSKEIPRIRNTPKKLKKEPSYGCHTPVNTEKKVRKVSWGDEKQQTNKLRYVPTGIFD